MKMNEMLNLKLSVQGLKTSPCLGIGYQGWRCPEDKDAVPKVAEEHGWVIWSIVPSSAWVLGCVGS